MTYPETVAQSHTARTRAVPRPRRVDVNFFETGQVVGEHFHQREAHGCVACRGHPESPIAGGLGERALVGGLGQHGLRCMAPEQLSRRQLDRGER